MLASFFLLANLFLIPLQEVYEQAGSGEGYDKLLILEPDSFYTGGLTIEEGITVCIHGRGAIIDLMGESITLTGSLTLLDIDHCVIVGGERGLFYGYGAHGKVINNTFYANSYGIQATNSGEITIKNNIISNSDIFGIYSIFSDSFLWVGYNDCWGSGVWNYARMADCGCTPEEWYPSPATGEIQEDPLFVDPNIYDFHLQPNSPCIGAGEGGVNMGAYDGLGIEESRKGLPEKSIKLRIYPNPAKNKLFVQLDPNSNGFRLEVFDPSGRRVLSKNLSGEHKFIFERGSSQKGVYIFRIIGKDLKETRKVVIF